MSKSKFGRTTLGIRDQVQICKAVAYTAAADYKTFCTTAVEGEIGIFEDTYAQLLLSGAALVTITKSVFIAMMRATAEGPAIEKTQVFRPTDFTIRYSPYAAPVKQVLTAALAEGSTASFIIQDITYTAKTGGTTSNDITITYVVAGASTALSVVVVGKAITVNIATSAGSAATSTATQVLAAIVASAPASALVSGAITGTAATVQTAQSTTNLQGGTTSVPLAKGTRFAISVMDLDPKYQPFPTYQYEVQARSGESFDAAVQRLVDTINDTQGVINKQRDRIVSATYSASTNTITFTSLDFGTAFKVYFPSGSAFSDNYTVTVTVKPSLGSGTPTQIRKYAETDLVADGVTTSYPMQGQLPGDWGAPASFVSEAETYDIFNFSGMNNEPSKTPHHRQHLKAEFAVIVPLSGTNPDAAMKTMFGF